jgi:cytochrome c oxidase subunit 2
MEMEFFLWMIVIVFHRRVIYKMITQEEIPTKPCPIFSSCDAAEPWQLGVQDPATPIMEGMMYFNNYLVFFMIFIGTTVFYLLYYVLINFNNKVNTKPIKFNHSSILEIIWTIIPAVILIFIAIPSFALLYSIDELIEPEVTLKIIGHQWYWSYEYADEVLIKSKEPLMYDSYMLNVDDLRYKKPFRLLDVDNIVILPINTHIRLLITSADVLHSWCIPSFGIKLDACPGRLSQTSLFIKRQGKFYGQCSEICGVNHGFMPICVRSVSRNLFKAWAVAMKEALAA